MRTRHDPRRRPSSGGAGRIATRLPAWSPRAVAAAVAVLGYIVLAILLIGAGMILTQFLVPGPVGGWDNSVNEWFAARRTATWDTVTDYASILAGTGTVLIIAGATTLILAFRPALAGDRLLPDRTVPRDHGIPDDCVRGRPTATDRREAR